MGDLMIFFVVLGIAVVATVIVLVLRASTSHDGAVKTPLDTEVETLWLIEVAPAPWRRFLQSVDRRVAGGAVVAVAFAGIFATSSLVGWIFSGVDEERGVAQWDSAAAEYGRDRATVASTRVLELVTDLGGTVYLFVLMALIGASYAVRRSDIGPLVYLLVVGIGITLLNNGLKLLIDRDRPDIAQLSESAGSSFPSGHTAAAAACWAAMVLVVVRRRSAPVRRVGSAVAIFVAVSVAATRVLLGVHWLSDVVAGLVVGWGWWLVTTIVFGGRTLRLGAPAETATAMHVRTESITSFDPRAPEESSRQ